MQKYLPTGPVKIDHKCSIRSCTVTIRYILVKPMIPNALLERYAWSNEFKAGKQQDLRHPGSKGLRDFLARSLRNVGRV